MTDISAKYKFSKDFCINDENLDLQAEKLRSRMMDIKIEIFGPRRFEDIYPSTSSGSKDD